MILLVIIGLVLPGYALARVLRAPAPLAAAFPLSSLLLAEIVIGFTLLGVPIAFGTVLIALGIAAAVTLIASHRRWSKPQLDAPSESPDIHEATGWLVGVVAALVVLVLSGMADRTILYPLSGADTSFRWEALARQMLEQQSLAYYPPITAEDFHSYTYPDGFPPLVSTAYWWLYAAHGAPWPASTSIVIVLQAASCLALVFYAARTLFGTMGGLLALAALASASLFNTGIAIGQETGYTALFFAGQLAFAIAVTRQPSMNLAVMAGLFAGLGALAREYGPALRCAA